MQIKKLNELSLSEKKENQVGSRDKGCRELEICSNFTNNRNSELLEDSNTKLIDDSILQTKVERLNQIYSKYKHESAIGNVYVLKWYGNNAFLSIGPDCI